jgi:hypothetical protein
MIRIALLSLALMICGTAPSGASDAQGTCNLESIRSITPADAVIDSVIQVSAPVSHCEVVGHIITTDPGPNRVEFAVMLPDANFNGRYYFIGVLLCPYPQSAVFKGSKGSFPYDAENWKCE